MISQREFKTHIANESDANRENSPFGSLIDQGLTLAPFTESWVVDETLWIKIVKEKDNRNTCRRMATFSELKASVHFFQTIPVTINMKDDYLQIRQCKTT